MALPVDLEAMGSFKGPQGNTGTLAFATAESVPANANAEVEMVGPEENRGAHFKMPRGLPGVNAVPADEAFATYAGASDTLTGKALLGRFVVHRLEISPGVYQPRVNGAPNLFIGNSDASAWMNTAQGDHWVAPDAVMIATIATLLGQSGSSVNVAARRAVGAAGRWIPAQSLSEGAGVNKPTYTIDTGGFGAGLRVWRFTPGVEASVDGSFVVPDGWSTARLSLRWLHNAESFTGAFRLRATASIITVGGDAILESGVNTWYHTTTSTPIRGALASTALSGRDVPVTPGEVLRFTVGRFGSSASDTSPYAMDLVGAMWEKRS